MAEEARKKPAKEEESAPKKKGLPLKTMIMLAAVLLIEGVAISAVFLMAGGPAPVRGESSADDPAIVAEQPAEVLVIADKFQNTRRGRAYLYDTEIYIVVANKYKESIEESIEAKRAAITADVAVIIRKAEPAYLMEHELSTLKRQIRAALDQRLGSDSDGKPYVQEVLITRCDEYRSDG